MKGQVKTQIIKEDTCTTVKNGGLIRDNNHSDACGNARGTRLSEVTQFPNRMMGLLSGRNTLALWVWLSMHMGSKFRLANRRRMLLF